MPSRRNEIDRTVAKMVDFSYRLTSAIPEDAAIAAPPPQQYKVAPPGIRTREHRSGPRSSRLWDSLNRIEFQKTCFYHLAI